MVGGKRLYITLTTGILGHVSQINTLRISPSLSLFSIYYVYIYIHIYRLKSGPTLCFFANHQGNINSRKIFIL